MALDVFYSGRAALEVTRGTDLTPTRLIYFETCTEEQDIATIHPSEHRNSYFPVYSSAAGPEKNTLNFQGRLSYDDIGWWLNLFVKGGVAPTGAGADRTFTFTPASTTDDVKTATFQLGYADTIATAPGYKYNYGFGQTLNIHAEKNDDGALTFNATLLAAKAATSITAYTGSLSDRTVTLASANNTQVYLDTTTIGTTADANVISWDWTLDIGPVPLYTLDGTTAANQILRPNWRTWTLTLVRQYANATERSIYQSKAERKIRMQTTGPALGGSNYRLTVDAYGVYTNRRSSTVDGIVTEELTVEPIYDTTATTDFGVVLVNANTVAYT